MREVLLVQVKECILVTLILGALVQYKHKGAMDEEWCMPILSHTTHTHTHTHTSSHGNASLSLALLSSSQLSRAPAGSVTAGASPRHQGGRAGFAHILVAPEGSLWTGGRVCVMGREFLAQAKEKLAGNLEQPTVE